MNVDYVNPFLGSLVEVLATMANTTVERGQLSIKGYQAALGDVTGRIDMRGDATGSLAVSFTESAILSIFANMIGEEREKLDEEVADLVGEITNMVSGGAKRVFSEKGYNFDMATPQLLTGKGHIIDHGVDGRTILVPFKTPFGEFFVEVCFEEGKKKEG
ncbi:chemotaxis protein CheX [Endothiovibrio diazotrophicus]